jgi:sec-independent protein translocase protein TatA
MLGLDNPVHIVFLLVLLFVVFGAKRLPEMGRSLGSGMRGFRESLSGEPGQHAVREQPLAVPTPESLAAAVTATERPTTSGGWNQDTSVSRKWT